MADRFQHLAAIIESMAYQWIDYTGRSREEERFLMSDRELAARIWPVFDSLIEMQWGHRIRPRPTDITLGAVRHMYYRAELLRRSRRPNVEDYEASDLELYIADFIVRAYATIKPPMRTMDLALFGDVVITEDVVDTTADDLPKDWPTDWWREKRLRGR